MEAYEYLRNKYNCEPRVPLKEVVTTIEVEDVIVLMEEYAKLKLAEKAA